MASPTNSPDPRPPSHYRSLFVTIVASFVGVMATKHVAPHFVAADTAQTLQNMVWLGFGLFLYRNALITGVLDHLGETRRLFDRYTQHNTNHEEKLL